MKNIKLNAAKSLFIIALACPFAFADDGDQGSGGLADTTIVKTNESSLDGDQGSGGRPTSATKESYFDTVLSYFDWLIS